MRARPALLTIALLLTFLPIAAAQEPTAGSDGMKAELKRAEEAFQAVGEGDLAKAALRIGVTIAAEDIEGWKKALGERIATLRLLVTTIRDRERLTKLELETTRDRELRDAELARLPAPPRRIPPEPDQAALDEGNRERDRLKAELDAAEKSLGARKEVLSRLEDELATFPSEVAELSRSIADAEAEAPDGLDGFRLENRRIRLRYLEGRLALAPLAKPVWEQRRHLREVELEIAKAKLESQREYLTRLGEELRRDFAKKAARLQASADAARVELELPDLGEERRARLETDVEVFGILADEARDRAFLQTLDRRQVDEEKLNADLLADLTWMKERFEDDRSVSRRTAGILRNLHRRARRTQADLRVELRPWLAEQQEIYGSARAEVSDRDRQRVREEESPELEAALALRKRSIAEVISELREIDTLLLARKEALGELQPLVISRIFRVRSDDPLGEQTVLGVRDEVARLAFVYTGSGVLGGLAGAFRERAWQFALFALGSLFLVALGIWLGRRLSRYRTRWKFRGGSLLVALQRFVATVVISSLAPLCLVLAAQLLGLLGAPKEIEVPGRELLYGLAGVFFARRFLWSLFQEDGIAVTEFSVPPEVAGQLLRASRWTTAGLLFLAVPWWVLSGLPLSPSLVHLPRVLYTLMLACGALLLSGLLRRGGALVSSLTGRAGFWYQVWVFLGPLISIGLFAIVLMDALGFRYGARDLTSTVGQTLLAGFLIVGLYNLIQSLIDQAAKRVRRRLLEELGRTGARAESTEAMAQVTRFVSVAVVVVALLLLANFWGIADNVEGLLDSVRIATVDEAAGVHVTLWNVLSALLWIVSAHFLIAHLPGLYEFVLFPRLGRIDMGTRFALLAVSRYAILIVAYSAAILSLHISFSSLGYIFAALSVGIGFGLQEVVSNFISGLILFFERPVRVGDFVSVGGVLGTVNKISIRATEVVNRDRQVIIIPNRQFITEQVTNWSHNDENVRTTIEVGVSYSSDVVQVAKVLTEILDGNERVLKDPPPKVVFRTFGDSSLNFLVRPFTTIENRVGAINEINAEIMRRFREEGIEIPFPQRDLHLRSVDAGVQFTIGREKGGLETGD